MCTKQTTPLSGCGQGRIIRCLRFGPELGDGWVGFIASDSELRYSQGLLPAFLRDGAVGDSTTIEVVEMLEYDYERLREI